MLLDVSHISQIPASPAKRNILRAVTHFEKKTGIALKSRRWYVVASMSSEYSKAFPEALAEVVGTRDCSPCGYRVEFDAALASEIWLVCDGRCVMWSRL